MYYILDHNYWKCIISLKEIEGEGKNTLPTQHSNKSRKKRGTVITDFDWVCFYDIGSAPSIHGAGSVTHSRHLNTVHAWSSNDNEERINAAHNTSTLTLECEVIAIPELEHTNHMWCI